MSVPDNINISDLHDKIHQGIYRDVFRYKDYAIKVMRPWIRKRFMGIGICIPTCLYTLLRFGIRDFNEYEFHKYKHLDAELPSELQSSFARILGVYEDDGRSYSVCELVTDANGQPSKTLLQVAKVSDANFWDRINELEQFFTVNDIAYLSVGGDNVCVQQLKNGDLHPVMIDYKRIGRRTFSHQLLLWFRPLLRMKMRRRFRSLKKKYCCTVL